MRSSIILASLLATLALANPVDKRALTTKVEVVTVWTTVTEGSAPTGYSGGRGRKGGKGGRGGRHRSSSAAAEPIPTVSSVEVVVPTSPSSEVAPAPTEEAPSSYEAPAPTPEEPTPTLEQPTPAPEEPTSPPEEPAPVPTEVKEEPSSAPPAAEPTAPASNDVSSYGQKILQQHNIHRANHTDTGPLTWSDKLTATALKIANSCVYEHDTDVDKGQYESGYGQNIGAGAPPEDIPAMITNGMYNDEAPFFEGLYGQDDPDMSNFKAWGHFSQIVWRNTKEVGCATVKCDSLANTGGSVRPYFTVCNYSPPGNYGGEYGKNVGTRLGKATVTV